MWLNECCIRALLDAISDHRSACIDYCQLATNTLTILSSACLFRLPRLAANELMARSAPVCILSLIESRL